MERKKEKKSLVSIKVGIISHTYHQF